MKKLVLISCSSKKLDIKSTAERIYISPLFRKNLEYAKTLSPDGIYILSAEHGLLELKEKINPYDKTLNTMSSDEIRNWSQVVLKKLETFSDFQKDEFIFLAGQKYHQYLTPKLNNVKIPMQGLRTGEQLRWLTKET